MSDEIINEAAGSDEGELRDLLGRARQGDLGAVPALREALDRQPGVWRAYGDLAAHAQAAWIGLAGGTDLALRESLARQVAAIRDEAAGPAPTPLETLLASRVAACWLQAHHADAMAAREGEASTGRADFARKRQDSAHRRYLSAIAALAMVRKLLPPAATPATPPGPGHQLPGLQVVPGPGGP